MEWEGEVETGETEGVGRRIREEMKGKGRWRETQEKGGRGRGRDEMEEGDEGRREVRTREPGRGGDRKETGKRESRKKEKKKSGGGMGEGRVEKRGRNARVIGQVESSVTCPRTSVIPLSPRLAFVNRVGRARALILFADRKEEDRSTFKMVNISRKNINMLIVAYHLHFPSSFSFNPFNMSF